MKVLTIPEHCTRTHGANCTRCQLACPAKAISFDEAGAPVIDRDACTKCGVCMGVCDAFSSSSATALRLYNHLRKVAMRGEIVYLTCEENVFLVLSRRKRHGSAVLGVRASRAVDASCLLQNVPVCVACDLKYCEDCPRAAQIGEPSPFLSSSFSSFSPRPLKSPRRKRARTFTSTSLDLRICAPVEAVVDDEFDRRAAFDSVKDDAFDIISGRRRLKQSDTLKEAYRKKERERMREALNLSEGEYLSDALSRRGRATRVMPPRRRMLLEAYAAKPDIAENVEVAVSATDHDACVECLDCVARCASGARIATKEGHLLRRLLLRHCSARARRSVRATRLRSWKRLSPTFCPKVPASLPLSPIWPITSSRAKVG